MGRKCQIVMGPAGSGKSTYCHSLVTHMQASKRSVRLCNLDPAAENFEYEPRIDIRDLISLDDVTEELQYGPNGALIYCMEFLVNNIEWLHEELGDEDDDDYWIFDCPGQIELYTHFPVMKHIITHLQRIGFTVCAVYTIEATFVTDPFKFFSACMSAMSAMVQLEVPHVNVLTKMDLLRSHANMRPGGSVGGDNNDEGTSKIPSRQLERFLFTDTSLITDWTNGEGKWVSDKWKHLNEAIARLIDEYNMVAFIPLDITDEDSLSTLLLQVDHCVQYGEDVEPTEPKDDRDMGDGDD
ncbi:hypothetical protein RI367_001516 [Sorochytrium milnesiophthora]